jgi:hypothetical protein
MMGSPGIRRTNRFSKNRYMSPQEKEIKFIGEMKRVGAES